MRRSGVPENGREQDRLKGDASSNQARACLPGTWFTRTLTGMAREGISRRMASHILNTGCSSRKGGGRFALERSVAKQNIDCKVLNCALPIQLSFLTSRNCTRQGCLYPPEASGSIRDRILSALECLSGMLWKFLTSWVIYFPIQWPTKRFTGSSAGSCE